MKCPECESEIVHFRSGNCPDGGKCDSTLCTECSDTAAYIYYRIVDVKFRHIAHMVCPLCHYEFPEDITITLGNYCYMSWRNKICIADPAMCTADVLPQECIDEMKEEKEIEMSCM